MSSLPILLLGDFEYAHIKIWCIMVHLAQSWHGKSDVSRGSQIFTFFLELLKTRSHAKFQLKKRPAKDSNHMSRYLTFDHMLPYLTVLIRSSVNNQESLTTPVLAVS